MTVDDARDALIGARDRGVSFEEIRQILIDACNFRLTRSAVKLNLLTDEELKLATLKLRSAAPAASHAEAPLTLAKEKNKQSWSSKPLTTVAPPSSSVNALLPAVLASTIATQSLILAESFAVTGCSFGGGGDFGG